MDDLHSYLSQTLPIAAQNNHRLPLLLSGSQPWLSQQLQTIHSHAFQYSWFFSDQTGWIDCEPQPWTQAKKLLGLSIECLIIDLTQSIPADALGIVSGALKGGGLLVLLLPNNLKWPEATPFHSRAARIVKDSKLPLLTEIEPCIPVEELSQLGKDAADKPARPCATRDQQYAVEGIKRVLTGHRRRPLVITADRGRGKSTALGIAAAQLIQSLREEQQRTLSIVVTAPSRKAANTLFYHAAELLRADEGCNVQKNLITASGSQLKFIAPDELANGENDRESPAQLVLVDEAAAIPAPLLEKLLRQHSRIVFASTIHGYEGTGRGFAIRFKKTLNAITPKWQQCQLKEPIRWNSNDPVENFLETLLLLNADSAPEDQVANISVSNTCFQAMTGAELANDESLLREVFGLLINAHYQTSPNDLVQMLDQDDLTIALLHSNKTVIATALVCHEGGFDKELAAQIWAGKRRPKGHLLPQTLAAQGGFQGAPTLKMARIVRIAVHPDVQGKGFGQHLIQSLRQTSIYKDCDLLGSSFGATPELLDFWSKCNLKPLLIGSTRNSTSGCHSVIVGQGISEKGQQFIHECCSRFHRSLPFWARHTLSRLEHEVLLRLFKQVDTQVPRLASQEIQCLQDFCNEHRNFDSTLPELLELACDILPTYHHVLTEEEQAVLAGMLLQNLGWAETVKRAVLKGRKEAEQVVLGAVTKLMNAVDRRLG